MRTRSLFLAWAGQRNDRSAATGSSRNGQGHKTWKCTFKLYVSCSDLKPLFSLKSPTCGRELVEMASIGPELPPHLLSREKYREDGETQGSNVTVGPQFPSQLSTTPVPGPLLPPTQAEAEEESEEDDYGPALPPDLLAARTGASSSASTLKKVVGPSFPHSYGHDWQTGFQDDDDSDEDVGPKPLPTGYSFQEEDGVREFIEKEERRRKQVEVSNITSVLIPDQKNAHGNWMVEHCVTGSCEAKGLEARRVDVGSTVVLRLTRLCVNIRECLLRDSKR